jgi:pyrroloquinoline quinone (PQQ) biosynthesis protein C
MATARKYEEELKITSHYGWSQQFWDDLIPVKDQISQHPFFQEMAAGTLNISAFRYALLNFYPLVAQFPAFMGLALAKIIHFQEPGMTEARSWLIQNIKVEERHLHWYQDWAHGFGITLDELKTVRPPVSMNAINHFLWDINHRGNLAESLAATNLAIEWATGDWTLQVYKGMEAYAQFNGVEISKRSLAWLRAHAHYDDLHPYEAMELIKRICHDKIEWQEKAFLAAKEGLEYYILALDDCYQQYLMIANAKILETIN